MAGLSGLLLAAPGQALPPARAETAAASAPWPALTLSESLAATPAPALARDEGTPAEQPTEQENPDSQPLLEEEARQGNSEALAKEAQNPIANLISVPIQWNATPSSQWAPTAIDPSAQPNRTLNIWNIQPVVPFPVNRNLLLVSRTVVPVIHRPLAGESDVVGIGDINPTIFLVPLSRSSLQVGFGPTLVIPSATDLRLSSQRWSAGPAGVAVYTKGNLVGGVLVNNIWSFAGSGGRDVNAMLIQPFLNINLANGWYLISSPIITADWTAADGEGWTVPVGGGIGRIFRLGTQPFNASLQAFWNARQPRLLGDALLGDVTIRLQIQALFPIGS